MKETRIQNIQAVLLSLLPILGLYYIIPGISIGFLLLLLALLLELKVKRFNKKIVLYFASIMCLSIISYAFSIYQVKTLFVNNSIQVIMIAILLSYYTTTRSSMIYIKSLLIFAIISTIVIFIQTFSYHILNTPIPFYLPIGDLMIERIEFSSIFWGRPGSFFLEPAHYCIYILPVFYYTLVNNKTTISIVLLLGILFSTSTTGFAIAILLILYHQMIIKRNVKYTAMLLILSLFLMLFLYEYITPIVARNLEKLDSDAINENIRIFGMIPLLSKMDNFQLIFGIGHNQLAHYFSLKNIETYNYANSFIMSVFSFGILSLFSIWYLLQTLYKENNDKGYFIILIFVLFSDQILFNQNFFFLVVTIYLLKHEHMKNNKLVKTLNI